MSCSSIKLLQQRIPINCHHFLVPTGAQWPDWKNAELSLLSKSLSFSHRRAFGLQLNSNFPLCKSLVVLLLGALLFYYLHERWFFLQPNTKQKWREKIAAQLSSFAKNGGNFPEIAARTVMEIFASFALALRLTELIQNEELWSEILYVFDTQM